MVLAKFIAQYFPSDATVPSPVDRHFEIRRNDVFNIIL